MTIFHYKIVRMQNIPNFVSVIGMTGELFHNRKYQRVPLSLIRIEHLRINHLLEVNVIFSHDHCVILSVCDSPILNCQLFSCFLLLQDEHTHAHLCDQFKARSVRRSYVSLTCGVPSLTSGRIEIPIGRDPRDRKRMAAIPNGTATSRARAAASRYKCPLRPPCFVTNFKKINMSGETIHLHHYHSFQ
jgi:hypothetical protein